MPIIHCTRTSHLLGWTMETVSGIPVVDFSVMSVEHKAIPPPSDDRVQTIAKKIHEAFSTVGFVYLKNHGITPERVIRDAFSISTEYFTFHTFFAHVTGRKKRSQLAICDSYASWHLPKHTVSNNLLCIKHFGTERLLSLNICKVFGGFIYMAQSNVNGNDIIFYHKNM